MQGPEWARKPWADAALPAAVAAFDHEGSGRVVQGHPGPVLWPGRRTRGPPGAALRSRTAARRVSQARRPTAARPRRLRVRYERAGRSFYSAAAAGGAKMTPAQIAEAQRMWVRHPSGPLERFESVHQSLVLIGRFKEFLSEVDGQPHFFVADGVVGFRFDVRGIVAEQSQMICRFEQIDRHDDHFSKVSETAFQIPAFRTALATQLFQHPPDHERGGPKTSRRVTLDGLF
jgi:hypothetical protein